MAYFDRLQDASYIAPSGDQFFFTYEIAQREVRKRIGAFEFSEVSGTLHQDKGVSGEIYPFRIFFNGPDYDVVSDEFLEATKQPGPGFLLHPRWGRRRVQILSVSQSENLVEQGAQATFNVTFQETLEREFPETSVAPKQIITALKTQFKEEAVLTFVDTVKTENFADELALEQDFITSANLIDQALSVIASQDQDIFAQFNQNISEIINNASSYVDDPLQYANRVVDSVLDVAAIPGNLASKLLGYTAIIDNIKNKILSTPSIQNRNKIIIDELLGTSTIVSASDSINDSISNASSIARDNTGRATVVLPEDGSGFTSRDEILSAVLYIQNNSTDLVNTYDTAQELFENNLLSESYIQPVQSYVPTWQITSTVIRSGLEVSFSLPVKRTESITKDRTIFDLCNEFYKSVNNDILDFFILTNMLTGQNIITVPKNTQVIYYA